MSPQERLQTLRTQIEASLARAGRPAASCRLVLVSKTAEAAQLRPLAELSQQRAFAEGRVQSLRDKAGALADLKLEWHFIGPLQSNKVRECLKHISFLHSLDRWELAQALHKELLALGRTLEVLVQVNTSREAQKQGVSPEDTEALVRQIATLPTLKVRGLMTMAVDSPDEEPVRACFRELRKLAAHIEAKRIEGVSMRELSMGMSNDFQWAIEEGATMIRVGSLVFG
jgi:pyridoxal phosphate enzyme (YggS family)